MALQFWYEIKYFAHWLKFLHCEVANRLVHGGKKMEAQLHGNKPNVLPIYSTFGNPFCDKLLSPTLHDHLGRRRQVEVESQSQH